MILGSWAVMLVDSVQVTHRESDETLRTGILTAGHQ